MEGSAGRENNTGEFVGQGRLGTLQRKAWLQERRVMDRMVGASGSEGP